tara:strand:- start:670 stop:834 length:165 start_codon:yes stop_codon:yes gene_type:complete
MDWERLSTTPEKKKENNINHIEKIIIFTVLKELDKYCDKYSISKDNPCGKWKII